MALLCQAAMHGLSRVRRSSDLPQVALAHLLNFRFTLLLCKLQFLDSVPCFHDICGGSVSLTDLWLTHLSTHEAVPDNPEAYIRSLITHSTTVTKLNRFLFKEVNPTICPLLPHLPHVTPSSFFHTNPFFLLLAFIKICDFCIYVCDY